MDIVPQLIFNSLIAGSVYTLVVLGFNLIFSATKFFNLAHGAIAAVGAYIVFFLTKELGVHVIASVVIGIVFAGGAGYVLDKAVFLPLRKRKASTMVLLVASLGLLTAIQAILAMLFQSQFRSLAAGTPRVYHLFTGVATQTHILIFVVGAACMIALAVLLKKTMFGKSIRAISDDEEVSRIVGIDTDQVVGRVFFIGSALAGLAGIFVGFDTGIEPTMGLTLLLKGVIAAVIGGVGNVYGGVLGAYLLGFVENFGIWKISGEWKDAIAFGLLILFLLFRPQGIMKK